MFKWVVEEVTFAFIGSLANECYRKMVVKVVEVIEKQAKKFS